MEQKPIDTFRAVGIEIDVPERFSRVQLWLRLLICAALGLLHQSGAGFFGLLYFFLPVLAAILITQRGGDGYLDEDGPWLIAVLEWVCGFYAYMFFATDVLPLDTRRRALRLRVSVSGTPGVGSALLRLLASLPHLVVLALVGISCFVVNLVAFVSILVREQYSPGLRDYQQSFIASLARLLAYHGSLVKDYPLAATRSVPSEQPDHA